MDVKLIHIILSLYGCSLSLKENSALADLGHCKCGVAGKMLDVRRYGGRDDVRHGKTSILMITAREQNFHLLGHIPGDLLNARL